MALRISSQTAFLYQSFWTPSIDESLLQTLIRLKEEHIVVGSVLPKWFFRIATVELEHDVAVKLEWDALYDRFQFLESRFLSFNSLVKEIGTYWDVEFNIVIASDETWQTIFEHNKLARAYYHIGEPEYNQLSVMFGPKVLKQESVEDVIDLSDNTVVAAENEADLPNDGASFPSPLISSRDPKEMKSRRKLFFEDNHEVDRESSNKKYQQYYNEAPDGDFERRLSNNPPRRPLGGWGVSQASPIGSSCASSSPIGKWGKEFK